MTGPIGRLTLGRIRLLHFSPVGRSPRVSLTLPRAGMRELLRPNAGKRLVLVCRIAIVFSRLFRVARNSAGASVIHIVLLPATERFSVRTVSVRPGIKKAP